MEVVMSDINDKKPDHLPVQHMGELFSEMFGRYAREFFSPYLDGDEKGFSPRVEVKETEKGYLVSAEIPGVSEDDISVTLKDNCLVLEGIKENRHIDQQKGHYRSEFNYGSFYRSVPLQADVDDKNIEANYNNGILTIELTKREDGIQKTRKIAINKNKKH
jgi:HSP20 family protein